MYCEEECKEECVWNARKKEKEKKIIQIIVYSDK